MFIFSLVDGTLNLAEAPLPSPYPVLLLPGSPSLALASCCFVPTAVVVVTFLSTPRVSHVTGHQDLPATYTNYNDYLFIIAFQNQEFKSKKKMLT